MSKTYSQRAQSVLNPVAKRLLLLMEEKQTNLAISADVIKSEELLNLADRLGPEIALIKTHIDVLSDFTPHVTKMLVELAEKHKFVIFEDRKFADIGNTVRLQYQEGIYRISDWADIVNAHIIPGPGIIESLKKVGLPKGRALLLLAEMSSKGSLATGNYTQKCIEWAREHAEFVIGFIAQRKLDPTMLTMTPGVSLSQEGDQLGQQYNTPHDVIFEKQSDVMIVGRGILESKDPLAEARRYRKAGWEAYLRFVAG